MKTYLECIPCFFNQAIEAARNAGASAKKQKLIVDRIAQVLPSFPFSATPPEMGRIIYSIVSDITEIKDIYAEVKHKSNERALSVYPIARKKVISSSDRLLTALELAVSGNVIDYGIKNKLDVDAELKKILKKEKTKIKSEKKGLFQYKKFRQALKGSRTILYCVDNAGEIVFDKLLMEEIRLYYPDIRIICAVKAKPIINDALLSDALYCQMDRVSEIISSGSEAPGTVLKQCSKEFRRVFRKADMIISKGQGNFETLSKVRGPIFYLFMAKCPVVAKHVRGDMGDYILIDNPTAIKL
ncbi:MAG: ARMT1-like domain-containing protein [Candidatus Ancaeobacter aquaticus]|nr:ARMT1-like domain-containing protein [Candidatus Ancaeobacter aquaticus]